MGFRPYAVNGQSPLTTQVGGSHYKDCAIQPVEFIHANNLGYCEGAVIKYVTRWRNKGGIADLEKAKHFIDLLIELESAPEKNPDELSLGVAARCWCDKETESITLDPRLGAAFAKRVQWYLDLLEESWGIIANAGGGDWSKEADEWFHAAVKWREDYFALLSNYGDKPAIPCVSIRQRYPGAWATLGGGDGLVRPMMGGE